MNRRKAKQIAKACRSLANRIKELKQSSEIPQDAKLFNAGGFVEVNKDSSSMLMQVLQQVSEPPATNSEADSFNKDYDPRDEQTNLDRLRYFDDDPETVMQKRIDKEKVERQMQQVHNEMIGKFK